MAIGLGVSVFLGRTLGADGLGVINLSNRIINILLVVGLLGMRHVIIKEVAIAYNKKDYVHIGNVMYTAYWLNGGITLALSVLLILLSSWLANNVFNDSRLTYPLMVALVVMTPQIFSRLFSSALVGYQKIWQSNLVEQTLSTGIAGLLLLLLWLFKFEITINRVAVIYAIGRIIVTLSVGLYWKSLYQNRGKNKLITNRLLKTSLPLFIITASGIVMANADAIILGMFADAKDVGLYTVAARIALLTSFFLQVTNASVAPKIAALYESGKKKELEKMIQQVTKGLGFIGAASLFIFILLGKYILGIWGKEFINAYWVLIILSIGQFVNIAAGAVGIILVMTGFENIQSKISLIFIFINILLDVLFIYFFGIIGAAISIALVVITKNTLYIILIYKKLGIKTHNLFHKIN